MRSFSQKYDALTVTTLRYYVAAIGTLPLMLREIITHPEMDFLRREVHPCAVLCGDFLHDHSAFAVELLSLPCRGEHLFSVLPDSAASPMVLGVLLLNEHMTVGFIAGAVLIVFGVLYSTLGKEKTR